jgi:hypothetical protein
MSAPKGTAADAFRAAVDREGIAVEFGRSAADSVALTDRVVLPLETAKRLVLALNEPLARHAAKLRAGEDLRGHIPVNAPADQAGQSAALLLAQVAELGVPYQYERSFRMAPGALLANRFLLSVETPDLGENAAARALAICERLGMPAGLRAQAEARFAMAKCLHFGFEAGPGSILCKFYLEREVTAAERSAPALQHLAFKWDLLGKGAVVTEYWWHPAPRLADLEARLAQIYRGGQPADSLAIARGVIELAASRAPVEQLQYLEVQEPDNGRRSFDLNLYPAALPLRELQPLLHRMRNRYGVRPGQFQALYDQVRDKTLGHLSGGVHRDGQDFFNVYYGAVGFPRFHRGFA